MSLKNLLQFIKFFIGWPLSILALFFISRVVIQNKDVLSRLENINFPLLILAAISFFFYFFFRAYLWQKIIEQKGHRAPFKKTIFLWEIAEVKRFAPGFIWPFVSKTLSFSKDGLEKKTVAYSLAIEAEVFLVGCTVASLLCLPLILSQFSFDPLLKTLTVIVLISAAVLSSAIFIFAKSFLDFIKKTKIPFAKFLLTHAENSLPTFPWTFNLYLVALSIAALFFFGLGTYFSIVSIAYLTPVLIFQFVSFFILSLLIGYLSFFIPMGLGVREGVIIFGLSTFVPIAIASTAAIFSRIVLIISEFIFLIFASFWSATKNKTVLKIENFVSSHKSQVIAGAAIAIYIAYFTSAAFLRYDNFYTGRFDLGNMDQTIWNTVNGRVFQMSNPDGAGVISRLAFHADLILVLISPLYFIWEDPRMLLLLQTIVVAFGAVFIFKISNMILRSPNAAAIFSVLYLLNPALQYANLYDFHPVTLATTLLLGTFYFFMKRKYILFLIFAILAGITKEEVWVIIATFGLYTLISELIKLIQKKTKLSSKFTIINLAFGTGVAVVSLSVFYFLVAVAIPNARGGEHFALSYYSDFGGSPLEIIKNVIFSPGKIIELMGSDGRLLYLGQLLLPLGFISLFSPVVLIFALPGLAIGILSNNSNLHQIFYHYSATITPFIFIASIFGVKNLTKWFPKLSFNIILIFLTISTLAAAYLYGPLPGARRPNIDMFTKQLPDRKLIQTFIGGIPTRYTVAATNNLGSHLSRRRSVSTIPQGVYSADIVAFLLNDPFAQPSLKAQGEMAEALKTNPEYQLLFNHGDFVVFQKKSINFK